MIARGFTNVKKQELIGQIKEVGEDRPWEQPSPLSFSVPDEIFQPFRAGAVFYNSLVDKNIQTVGEIEKIWTEVQRLDDVYGSRLKNIQELAENLNAKIALIGGAIGTNLASALSQNPSMFLAGIDEINEKIFNNKVDIEYSKLVSRDEKGNLVYDYDAIIHLILYYKSDEQMSALQKLLDSMKDANGILDDKKYSSFMTNLTLSLSQNADLKAMIFGQVFPFGFAYDFENKYWFTREFSIQRLFGFADNINNLGKIFGMIYMMKK
jgi:hypothetical protein